MMPALDIFIIDHRTRCKVCGDKATNYTTYPGIPYAWISNIKGGYSGDRAKTDLESYHLRGDKEYDYSKLLRKNSIRGVCSSNPYLFKRNKCSYGSYLVLISCKCGESTWMFAGPSDDPNINNRKLKGNIYKYSRKFRLPNINIR